MIIFRYLLREVLMTTLAVSSILLLIIMSGRFVKFLAQAVSGQLSADVLLQMLLYRMPGFLELVLPLGFFIALLLAYGRLYMDSEMTVLNACGFTTQRLLVYTGASALLVAALVTFLSSWVSPIGSQRASAIVDQQRQRTEFEMLKQGQFQAVQRGSSVTYAEKITDDKKQMQDVFMADVGRNAQSEDMALIRSKTGEAAFLEDYQQRYLLLGSGVRYEGHPGQTDYRITEFDTLGMHLPAPKNIAPRSDEVDNRTTAELLDMDSLAAKAALQWRFSLPILVLQVALLAVPLSKTNPRQGRYAKMIPAILLYIIYLVALNAGRGAVEEGKLNPMPGIWWIHGIFTSVALLLLKAGSMASKPRRSVVSENDSGTVGTESTAS